MSVESLNRKQFGVQQSMLEQGNMDELRTRVAGFQNLTSNNFRPSFSEDYNTVRSMPSGTQFGENRTGMGEEE